MGSLRFTKRTHLLVRYNVGMVTKWLRALTDFPEDTGSTYSSHIVVNNCL